MIARIVAHSNQFTTASFCLSTNLRRSLYFVASLALLDILLHVDVRAREDDMSNKRRKRIAQILRAPKSKNAKSVSDRSPEPDFSLEEMEKAATLIKEVEMSHHGPGVSGDPKP
jgi:hypothetical protein